MTHKYERQCWSCGSRDMENKGPFVQCRACGATWNEIPEGHDSGLTIENDPKSPRYSSSKETRARPSGITQRRAARARGKIL